MVLGTSLKKLMTSWGGGQNEVDHPCFIVYYYRPEAVRNRVPFGTLPSDWLDGEAMRA